MLQPVKKLQVTLSVDLMVVGQDYFADKQEVQPIVAYKEILGLCTNVTVMAILCHLTGVQIMIVKQLSEHQMLTTAVQVQFYIIPVRKMAFARKILMERTQQVIATMHVKKEE